MKTDARVRYTKMRIREAFFQCLRKKPVSRITVKELCEIAEINRATFYTHYSDPFDLMEQLEAETLAGLQNAIVRQDVPGQDTLLMTLLRGMQSDRRETGLLASRNGDPNFGARISALFYEMYLPKMELHLPDCSDADRNAVYRFLAGGCANLLSDWVDSGMQESPEQLEEQINRLCAGVITSYQKK